MTKVNKSNLYRKVRSLLSKTVANDYTPGEALSAYEAAERIAKEYGLDHRRIDWPQKPSPAAVAMEEAAAAMAEMAPKAKRTTKPIPKGKTRVEQIWAMDERPEGVSIGEIVKATGVKPHTARAVLSVEKRKRGVKLELIEGRYRLVG